MLKFIYIFLGFLAAQNDCSGERYADYIFDVGTDYEILYGQNTNQTLSGSEYDQNLYMDIYYPIDDTLSDRPLIFFLFGGSFVEGSKNSSLVVSLCNKYAQMGYVAVAIDYRLSQHLLFTNPTELNGYIAVMKATHDLKAAIRYFRMNDELFNEYRIDSNRIFAGGYSAGAFTSINAAFLDQQSEIPSFLINYFNSNGGFEGYSGNPGYDSTVNGVVNLSGAIGDSDWLVEDDIPIVSMHGDEDDVVPYANDLVTLFGLNIEVDGSYIINEKMQELGNYSALYTYENEGHGPYSDMEFEADYTSSFLYHIVCPEVSIGDVNQDDSINILDTVMLVNFILELSTPSLQEIQASDMNDDGFLNIVDVVVLVNLIIS